MKYIKKNRFKKRNKFYMSIQNKIIIILFLIFVCTFYLLKKFDRSINSVIVNYAENETVNKATNIITSSIRKTLSKNMSEELYSYVFSKSGEILTVDFNNNKINEILYDLNSNLLEDIKKLETDSFRKDNFVYYIPFGIIYNSNALTLLGPKIPIKIYMIGSVESNIKIDLKEYGINNVLINLLVEISSNIQIMLPRVTKREKINLSVPIVTKIIEGNIPSVYGGMYSTSSNISSKNIEET